MGPNRRRNSSIAAVAAPTVDCPASMSQNPARRIAAMPRYSAMLSRPKNMFCTVLARSECATTFQEASSTRWWRCSVRSKPTMVAWPRWDSTSCCARPLIAARSAR